MNEEERKKIMEAPYRKIAAAEEQQEFDYLLTVYRALYKNKFRSEPIFPHSNVHLTQIKDLKKLAGHKAQDLLEFYFMSKDEWFIKQAYSLDCLLKNINRVNASFSSATRHRPPSGGLVIGFHCDACWEPFALSVPPSFDFNKVIRCETCTQSNKPPRRIDPLERRGVIQRLGSGFKDLPK